MRFVIIIIIIIIISELPAFYYKKTTQQFMVFPVDKTLKICIKNYNMWSVTQDSAL